MIIHVAWGLGCRLDRRPTYAMRFARVLRSDLYLDPLTFQTGFGERSGPRGLAMTLGPRRIRAADVSRAHQELVDLDMGCLDAGPTSQVCRGSLRMLGLAGYDIPLKKSKSTSADRVNVRRVPRRKKEGKEENGYVIRDTNRACRRHARLFEPACAVIHTTMRRTLRRRRPCRQKASFQWTGMDLERQFFFLLKVMDAYRDAGSWYWRCRVVTHDDGCVQGRCAAGFSSSSPRMTSLSKVLRPVEQLKFHVHEQYMGCRVP